MAETRGSFQRKCRVLVISSYTLVREGLRLLLGQEEDLEVDEVGLEKCETPEIRQELHPDVILVVWEGVTQDPPPIARLLEAYQGSRVLVLSPQVHTGWVKSTLSSGAGGYLPLDASPDELIHAIYKVSQGETFLHPTVLLSLLSDQSGNSSRVVRATLEEFSEREREVLTCLAHGLSDREIGQSLFISVRTVQTHLANIYAKLDVHSRTEAAIIAVQSGWFPPSPPQNR